MRELEILHSIVDENNGESGVQESLSSGDGFLSLHFETCSVVVVVVDPPDAIEMLVLPRYHVHEQSERFSHADRSARSCPPQVHRQTADDGPHEGIEFTLSLHAGVDAKIAYPYGCSQPSSEIIILEHTCDTKGATENSHTQGIGRVDSLNQRSLAGTHHLTVILDFYVLIERLGGHGEQDRSCKQRNTGNICTVQ